MAASTPVAAQGNAEPTLCQVLTQTLPSIWKSEVLRLSGSFMIQRHAAVMTVACPGSSSRSIMVCVTSSHDLGGAPEVDYVTDLPLFLAISDVAQSVSGKFERFQVRAEISGRLFVAPKTTGFCHMNRFRAIMIVKDVQAFSIVRKPEKEAGN